RWWPSVTDVDGRSLPQDFDARDLQGLVLRRFAQLDQAIAARQWFDPWVFEMDAQTSPSQTVLPWVAGFAAAMERFPGLMRIDDARLMEPLALLYLHFDPDDLEDAQALQDLIDTLEPPADLGEAVQDIVRSLMLIADVTRPAAPVARPKPRSCRPHARKSR
ncbi:MAG TPA: YecA family protein, partial [Rubrivivax sp.]|nr:YecA family protein [Rubrivivax sp.]